MGLPVSPSTWRETVVSLVVAEICAANGGSPPVGIWQWRRTMRYLGVRKWRIISPCLCPWPYIRRDVLYLPHVRPQAGRRYQLLRFLVHETAEQVMCCEYRAPYCYVSDHDERHRIAVMVEERWCAAVTARTSARDGRCTEFAKQ